jgi:uncharacterized membrane protein
MIQYLLALPFLVFGVEHFLHVRFVASIVPAWIPWHPFWVCFCGLALLATGVSLVTGRLTGVATALAGAMVLSWFVVIGGPFIAHGLWPSWDSSLLPPLDRPFNLPDVGDLGGRIANAFMDLGMSGALFVCAGTLLPSSRVLAFGRVLVGVAMWTFGVLHFAFPAFSPGIPPQHETVQFPIPGHVLWVYLTGTLFAIGGVLIVINRETQRAAAWLAGIATVFMLGTWVPLIFADPHELTGGWLKHLGDIAGLLMLTRVNPASDPNRSRAAPAAAVPPPHDRQKSPAGLG